MEADQASEVILGEVIKTLETLGYKTLRVPHGLQFYDPGLEGNWWRLLIALLRIQNRGAPRGLRSCHDRQGHFLEYKIEDRVTLLEMVDDPIKG
jgi:hypothetical protein